jgi:superfamily II DNA/RNA helicase
MLDMGFIPDIERICKLVPFTRQTLFFTATMPPEIRRITEQFLSNPVRVEVSKPATTVATTTQLLARSGRDGAEKRDTLRRLIRSAEGMKNGIIFCNRKRDVATLHRSLLRHGFSVQALHGDMDQSARTAALEQFRKNEVTLLVASDVAARGLDIPDVSHIYNFDVPIHPDDYVHRIGRTGRAGRSGTAISIVAGSNDAKAVAAIEKLIGQTIPYMDKIAGTPAEPQHEPSRETRHETRHEPRQTARPPQRGGRHEQQRRPQQPERRPQQPAPVARIEDARSRRAPAPVRKPMDDGDASHLPAFLLRPVPVKA